MTFSVNGRKNVNSTFGSSGPGVIGKTEDEYDGRVLKGGGGGMADAASLQTPVLAFRTNLVSEKGDVLRTRRGGKGGGVDEVSRFL